MVLNTVGIDATGGSCGGFLRAGLEQESTGFPVESHCLHHMNLVILYVCFSSLVTLHFICGEDCSLTLELIRLPSELQGSSSPVAGVISMCLVSSLYMDAENPDAGPGVLMQRALD